MWTAGAAGAPVEWRAARRMASTGDDRIPLYQCARDQAEMELDEGVAVCPACGLRDDTPGDGVLGDAFDIAPRPWRSREDPYLWRAVGDRLAATPTPTHADDVRTRVADGFRAVTGVDVDAPDDSVYLIDFDRGGFGGGVVDLRWWREQAIPLVVDRALTRRPSRRRRLLTFVLPVAVFRRHRSARPRS